MALGPPRPARLGWELGEDGEQSAAIVGIEGAAIGLPCAAPWYVDPDAGLAGPLEFGLPSGMVAAFLAAPPIDPAQASALGGVFERDFRGFDLPRPRRDLIEEIRDAAPVPVLRLTSRRLGWTWLSSRAAEEGVDVALLGFAYDGRVIDLAAAPAEMRRSKAIGSSSSAATSPPNERPLTGCAGSVSARPAISACNPATAPISHWACARMRRAGRPLSTRRCRSSPPTAGGSSSRTGFAIAS